MSDASLSFGARNQARQRVPPGTSAALRQANVTPFPPSISLTDCAETKCGVQGALSQNAPQADEWGGCVLFPECPPPPPRTMPGKILALRMSRRWPLARITSRAAPPPLLRLTCRSPRPRSFHALGLTPAADGQRGGLAGFQGRGRAGSRVGFAIGARTVGGLKGEESARDLADGDLVLLASDLSVRAAGRQE